MGFDMTLLKKAGLDTDAGIGYTGGEDKYLSAVRRYIKNHEKNRAGVTEYHEARDLESYAIAVHALKSNSRMIGAADLGDLFEELETAAKAGDTETVDNKTSAALASYDDLIEKLEPVGGLDEITVPGEISADEARDTAERLMEALDDFDDELSKELALRLAGYPFRITQRDMLEKAAGYIDDFMYDEAAELIKEIYPAIT